MEDKRSYLDSKKMGMLRILARRLQRRQLGGWLGRTLRKDLENVVLKK